MGFWLGEKRFRYFGYRVSDLAVPLRLQRTCRFLSPSPQNMGIPGPGEMPGDGHAKKAPWRTPSSAKSKIPILGFYLLRRCFFKVEVCIKTDIWAMDIQIQIKDAKHASSISLDSVTMGA